MAQRFIILNKILIQSKLDILILLLLILHTTTITMHMIILCWSRRLMHFQQLLLYLRTTQVNNLFPILVLLVNVDFTVEKKS